MINRVPGIVANMKRWLETTEAHPLQEFRLDRDAVSQFVAQFSVEPSGAARCHGTDEGTWARCRLPSGHGGEHDFVEPFRPRITLEKLRAMRSTHGHGGPVVGIPGDAIARCCSCGASVKLVRQVYGYNICATCDDATSPLNRKAEPT